MRGLAEKQILTAITTSIKTIRNQDLHSSASSQQATLRKLQSILDYTRTAVSTNIASEYDPTINEKLRTIVELLPSFEKSSSSDDHIINIEGIELCSW
jgi:hypothetical protein